MINTIGMLGTTVGPIAVGWLKDYTGTFAAGLVFVAGSILLGTVCVFAIPRERKGILQPAAV
jgi:cyanate permease